VENEEETTVVIESQLQLETATAAVETESEAATVSVSVAATATATVSVEGSWEEKNKKNVKKNRLVYAALSFIVSRINCNSIKMPSNTSVIAELKNTGQCIFLAVTGTKGKIFLLLIFRRFKKK
jgi:hypothetical protein